MVTTVSGNEVGQFIVLQQAVAIGIALLEYFFELRSLRLVKPQEFHGEFGA
jgi:hypothetical protein